MAELSSNWKELQARLKAEEGTQPQRKRKATDETNPHQKRVKTSKPPDHTASPASQARQRKHSPKRAMGGVHSSKMESGPRHGPSPSLALWAEDNDISTEALAEAYELGAQRDNSMMMASAKDKVNHGLSEGVEIGKYVAMDCEMVGVGPGGHESSLARVSLVDFNGRQVYDSYVKQKERVTDWRTAVSGISQKEMRFARSFDEVQRAVFSIVKDRILVGHDIKHDLEALKLSHPPRDIRDTARYHGFKRYGHGRKPALRTLAREILAVEIQEGPHSSIEDARVTMLLFRKHKPGFDVDHANRYAPKPAPNNHKASSRKPKKSKSRNT
ncbi:3'-5' exonuclease [Purpureocillium takamizusanense]|uniref:RNA exonuclease 4 n=1 Tax=Purpureocillium takamizusanense TaxID=2060973 RepID=A0A9Q8VC65_9HYPO|nr:3'-5' exonuclease [Purpureocillium takamizusanense]UNI20403.1 3'-5' exonuclease [Purpureocillium takamizusanense]